MIRDTSLEAYRGVDLTAGQAKIVSFLLRHQDRADFTRGEIAALSGIPINCVCPRVLELIVSGVLMEMPRRACKFSRRGAYPVAFVPEQRTLELDAA